MDTEKYLIDEKLLGGILSSLSIAPIIEKNPNPDEGDYSYYDRMPLAAVLVDSLFFDSIKENVEEEDFKLFQELKSEYSSIRDDLAIKEFEESDLSDLEYSLERVRLSLKLFKGMMLIIKEIQAKIQSPDNKEIMEQLFYNHDLCRNLIKECDISCYKRNDIEHYEFLGSILTQAYNCAFLYVYNIIKTINSTENFTDLNTDKIKQFYRSKFQLLFFNLKKIKEFYDTEDIILKEQKKNEELNKEVEELIKKSKELLHESFEASYTKDENEILKTKRYWSRVSYCVLFTITIGVFIFNMMVYFNYRLWFNDTDKSFTIDRFLVSIPIIFVIYVIFRYIQKLDHSITHYEHKLSTKNILKNYKENLKNDSQYEKHRDDIHSSIIQTIMLKPYPLKEADTLPYLKEIKDIVVSVKNTQDKK